jgi:hypothetical protein
MESNSAWIVTMVVLFLLGYNSILVAVQLVMGFDCVPGCHWLLEVGCMKGDFVYQDSLKMI